MKQSRAPVRILASIVLFAFLQAPTLFAVSWESLDKGTLVYIEDNNGKIMMARLEQNCTETSKKVEVSLMNKALFDRSKTTINVDAENIGVYNGVRDTFGLIDKCVTIDDGEERGLVLALFNDGTIAVQIYGSCCFPLQARPIRRVKLKSVVENKDRPWQCPQIFGNGPMLKIL
jgi:hypothetical protein